MENGHDTGTAVVGVEKLLFREELVCTICWNLLRQPKILSCAHVFCQSCLQSYSEEVEPSSAGKKQKETRCGNRWGGGGGLRSDNDRKNSVVVENGNGVAAEEPLEEFECPTCHGITQIPVDGLENLPDPTGIDITLVEQSTEAEIKSVRAELQRRLEASQNVLTQVCSTHVDEPKGHFCNQCNEALCSRCVTENHGDHDCEGISEIRRSRVAALRGAIQPAYAFVEKAGEMVQRLDNDNKSILDNRDRCKENVREVFARIRSALDERERALQLTVDKYTTNKINAVADHRHKVAKAREKIVCCIESLSRLLENSSDEQILQKDFPLLEELDNQEQLILEVDGEANTAMHSSAYVGLKEDHVSTLLQEAPRAVTLCEFYPESNSGYYASRKIAVDDGKEEEENAYDVLRYGGGTINNLRYSRSIHHYKKPVVVRREGGGVIVRVTPDPDLSESPTPTNSLCSSNRSSLSDPSSGIFDHLSPNGLLPNGSPRMPHRFSSLLSPLPIREPLKVFNKLGGSRKESVHPCGLCVMSNGTMIISDIKNHCLRIIANSGKFIDSIGSEGKGSGHFEEPCGMCLDNKGNILVTQRQNPRIQKFTTSGKFVTKFGQKTLRGSNLSEPWSICSAPSGEIYVADWDKSCVHIFQENGRYISVLGGKKSSVGVKLLFPGGIACDSHGRILVTDRGNHCVWLIQSDGSIVRRFGNKGHAPGELYYPYGVAVTPDGRVVVSESGNHRISVFSLSGEFQHCFGRNGGQPGFFDHPRHVSFNSAGELVVVDESNERLQIFSLA